MFVVPCSTARLHACNDLQLQGRDLQLWFVCLQLSMQTWTLCAHASSTVMEDYDLFESTLKGCILGEAQVQHTTYQFQQHWDGSQS